MSGDTPRIGQPVELRDDDGLTYTSRVEDVDDDSVTVARPIDLRAAIDYVDGLQLDLVWTLPSGIHVLPTQLMEQRTEKQIRLWQLAITGEGWTEQRREYVRVTVAGRILLTPLKKRDRLADQAADEIDGQAEPVAGELVDISEVAAQCRVSAPPDDERIGVNARLQCEFSLNGTDFRHPGYVIIARPAESTQQATIVVQFDVSKNVGDALRKQVFAAQLANRR